MAALAGLAYVINTILLPRIFGREINYFVLLFLVGITVFVFGVAIRLGHLTWFSSKDGKKHRMIVWLEDKLPFLRAGIHRK